TMLGRQNAMPQNPVPAAPPSTRPHQHREVDGIFKTVQSFDGVAEDIILSVRMVGELGSGYNWAASILCVRNMEDCDAVRQRRFHFPQLLGRRLHGVRLHRMVLAAHHSIHGPVSASRYLRLAESNLGDSANRIPAPCRVGVPDHAKPGDGRAKYPTSSASTR